MPLKTTAGTHGEVIKGRGAPSNIEGRFEVWNREASDDGWFQDPGDEPLRLKTTIHIEHAKSVISRHKSPDLGFSQSINPYRGCSHGCSYCISGDTLILMANGRTLPISELRVGDEIYGTTFDGKYRRYKKTKVLAHWSSIKPAFETTLEDGTTLVTSGDHRFLTKFYGWKYVTNNPEGSTQRAHLTTKSELVGTGAFAEGPAESKDYRRGYLCGMLRGDARMDVQGSHYQMRLALCDAEALLRAQDYLLDFDVATQEGLFRAAFGNRRAMHYVRASSAQKFELIRRIIDWPAEPTKDWSRGFLAGIFDAEGSYSKTRLRVNNTDKEIIDWTCRCLRAFAFRFVIYRQSQSDKKAIDTVVMKGGLREHLRFFHTVHPAIIRKLNLEGRAIKVQDAKLRVVSVEPLGKAMRLFDITTGTEDFIANGVVSHNCFARPSHAYLGLSPGLDFETRLSAKVNAAEKLREELAKPGYQCDVLTIGVNTDAYQPIERQQKITRSILEVASECHQPVSLITKSALIERDIDILGPMAKKKLVAVTLSITTLDNAISMKMEPRTSAPARRLLAVKRLTQAGIPVNVNVSPVIPFLTDSELEPILEAAAAHGAVSAGYTLVRLPWEVRPIFKEWLEKHFPLKAEHVMSRIRDMRDGREHDPEFGSRMVGKGTLAELLEQR
ncbi:MAG TPA: PA0069 family radical SAM protein, partial [Gemmatimonadaceae bacterium]|nr:PA0069 family radical SAM protein [Gemmatimonadaceae bacterium]